MGFFDFLKNKELKKIEELTEKVKTLQYLEKFKIIADAEKEANKIIEEAHKEAELIIFNAKKEAEKLNNESIEILKIANKRKLDIESRNENSMLKIKERLKLSKQEAEKVLNNATTQANTIINNAEKNAEKIAGEAYTSLKKSENLKNTIKALKNKINGYGDDYIIPTYSLLDELADDFGYSEAGKELKKARERSRLMVKNNTSAKCEYVEDSRKKNGYKFCN